MHRGVALAVALTAAAAAVAIVAVDLQFNIEATLETQRDGEWGVVATLDADGFASPRFRDFAGCASPDMRIVVHNGLPWATDVDVQARVVNYASGQDEILVQQTPAIARGDSVSIPFTVPDWAVAPSSDPERPDGPASLEVFIGDTFLGTCVEAP